MLPFIDLKSQYSRIETQISHRINAVLNHGQYIMGPEVNELESKLSTYIGSKHCIAVSSGTDALLMALMAINIKPDDEVIIPDFTFFATAEVILLLRAKPVFIDIDKSTYNLDPKLLEAKITNKTRAIMPVSMFGQTCDMDTINNIAKNHDLIVIEDGAQSFGATYKSKKSLNLSEIGCTSFFPSKPLGCYGDGGAIFTNNNDLAQSFREILAHGSSKRYHHTRLGINGRMDTIQAAILLEKIKIFDEELERRQVIANYYNQNLNKKYKPPIIADDKTSAFAQYTIQVENRNEVCQKLKDKNIPTAVHYPCPVSQQPIIKSNHNLNVEINPSSLFCSEHVLSLPMHPYLATDEQEKIIAALNSL